MPITNLSFTNVGPFDEIGFEFDPQVNVFTGPNNSGKSSALWVLGELLVYPFTMPAKLLTADSPHWSLKYSSTEGTQSVDGNLPSSPHAMKSAYEALGYTCFIPAQRHGTNFRSAGPSVSLDTEARLRAELDHLARERPDELRKFRSEQVLDKLWSGKLTEDADLARRGNLLMTDTSLVSDESVIQKIVDLDYAAYREGRPEMRATIDKVGSLVSKITEDFQITFLGVGKDNNGLFPQFGTPDGPMPLNVLSQGTQSVIQCLARVLIGYAEYYDFPPDIEEKPGVVIIDEIDAHLHPSWQRRVIPTLTQYFPKLQIFCSTHSPMLLAGLTAGQAQLLRRDEQGRVTVSTNESDVVGWTADEILRNLLEIPSPTDNNTAKQVRRLQELRRQEELSAEEAIELKKLRDTVSKELFSGPISAQAEQFLELLKYAKGESTTSSRSSTSKPRGDSGRRRPRA